MLNVLESIFETEALVDKEMDEARGKVRAAMRDLFSWPHKPTSADAVEHDEYGPLPQPRSATAPGQAVKPYIPPTLPTDNEADPFGLGEAPL